MLPTTIFASVAALAVGSQAAAILPRNKHVADFRLFGEKGCYAKNLGIWTVIDDDFKNNECKSLNDETVKSVTTVDINKGCKLYVFTDAACRHGRQLVPERACRGAPEGFRAWAMECL
ncbi:hypothetical protein HRG_004025 [Hirsutella rhossiliensis]|uniref:Uncharacterized protein n=1 Tax=Hirsutella rhossiliensis TaxID=111463 RepID=A0A9P8N381_9HYPO|nr:uncharacterized protein HRG_04025 [Hirsutella rhossiliensis]KAH0966009.1 hypothetical protein HRG_04025 [Hirsutella rhossiliensis]